MENALTQAEEYSGMRRRVSLLSLVVVNLLPLIGVFLFGWDVAALMILYWSENLIIGFYTLARMLLASGLGGIFTGLFFLIHYGGFCGGHGMFLITLLMDEQFEPFAEDPWPFFLVFPQLLFNVARQVLVQAPAEWLLAFGALFISHGISFVSNFLLGGERERTTAKKLMGAPYGRIVVLHIAIIAGGMGVMALGQPIFMLVVLVLLKLGMDVQLHLREHRRIAA